MGIDEIKINARFKDENLERIKKELSENLSLYLTMEELEDNLDDYFKIENDYLELFIPNCFGNLDKAFKYIKEEFIKENPNTIVEFSYINECYPELYGEKFIYKNGMTEKLKLTTSFYHEEYEYVCFKCGSSNYRKEYNINGHNLVCNNCNSIIKENLFDKTAESLSNFYNKIDFKLIK